LRKAFTLSVVLYLKTNKEGFSDVSGGS
jgi:hypothetical protein